MEKYKYKLSIIVPMYNSEEFIGACLDSILESDLPKGKYEIIVVNDGSKDNGPAIVMDYAAKHDNITHLTQENQGLSVTRNTGIRGCHGEYVWFVDSDDKICKNTIHAFNCIEQQPLDILAFRMKVFTKDGSYIISPDDKDMAKVNAGTLIDAKKLVENDFFLASACGYFLRKQFLLDHEIFFTPKMSHEDVEFSYRIFSYAEKLMYIEDVLYLYVYHANSMSTTVSPVKIAKNLKDNIAVANSKRNLAEKFKTSAPSYAIKLANLADNSIFGLVYQLFRNRKEWKHNGINAAVIDELKAQGLYPLRGDFHSTAKNIFKILLNQEWLLR